MKSTKNILETLIFLVCSVATGYFVYLQFLYYLRNEDVVSIAYRNFNEEEKDEYPQITICLQAMYGRTFFKNDLFKNSNFTPKMYERYLRGDWRQLKNSLTFDQIKYDDITFNINDKDYVKSANSILINGDKSSSEDISMILTFEDPSLVCYSKNVSFRRNIRYEMDRFLLNRTLLYEASYIFLVYIHKRNQLLSRLHMPHGRMLPSQYKNHDVAFGISSVEVLRGREGSNTPCNKSLTNEDAYRLNHIMTRSKCVPVYWRRVASLWKIGQSLPTCSGNQYGQVHDLYTRSTLNQKHGFYRPPCETMKISAIKWENEATYVSDNVGDIVSFAVIYFQDAYKEIVNHRGYTLETLMGQVGGFVGK